MVERDEMPVELKLLDIDFDLPTEQQVVEPVGGLKLRLIEAVQFLKYLALMLMPPLNGREAHIGPAVVVPLVAEMRGKRGSLAQRVLPFVVEDFGETFARRLSVADERD